MTQPVKISFSGTVPTLDSLKDRETVEDTNFTESQLMNDLFEGVSAWQCKICGDLVPTDLGQMAKHVQIHEPDEIYEQTTCPECDGEKYLDYADPYDPENSRRGACDVCNPHGDEPNEDEAYDRFKDEQAEIEMENRNGY